MLLFEYNMHSSSDKESKYLPVNIQNEDDNIIYVGIEYNDIFSKSISYHVNVFTM